MTVQEFHREFKIASDKVDSLQYAEFTLSERIYFLNEAILRIVKQKYSKNNVYQAGFEEIQKRTDDLKALVRFNSDSTITSFIGNTIVNTNVITITNSLNAKFHIGQLLTGINVPVNTTIIDVLNQQIIVSNNLTSTVNSVVFSINNKESVNLGIVLNDMNNCSYQKYTFPSDYMFYLSSHINIQYTQKINCVDVISNYNNTIKIVQIDDLGKVLNDPFNKPDRFNLIGVFANNEFRIYFSNKTNNVIDINYQLLNINFIYLKHPQIYVNLDDKKEIELSIHVHKEIVSEAVIIAQSYIQNNTGISMQTNLKTSIE